MDAAAHYKASTLLMFLTSHDEDDAKTLSLDLSALTKDSGTTLTIEKQRITIKLNNGLTFRSKDRYDYYTLEIPPVTDEPGVFYRLNPDYPQSGETDCFFISQYPTFFGERGRIVVDLWVEDEIVGVFKTDSSNFGAGGCGEWREWAK